MTKSNIIVLFIEHDLVFFVLICWFVSGLFFFFFLQVIFVSACCRSWWARTQKAKDWWLIFQLMTNLYPACSSIPVVRHTHKHMFSFWWRVCELTSELSYKVESKSTLFGMYETASSLNNHVVQFALLQIKIRKTDISLWTLIRTEKTFFLNLRMYTFLGFTYLIKLTIGNIFWNRACVL